MNRVGECVVNMIQKPVEKISNGFQDVVFVAEAWFPETGLTVGENDFEKN